MAIDLNPQVLANLIQRVSALEQERTDLQGFMLQLTDSLEAVKSSAETKDFANAAKLAAMRAEIESLREELTSDKASTITEGDLLTSSFLGIAKSSVKLIFKDDEASAAADPDKVGTSDTTRSKLRMVNPFAEGKGKVELEAGDTQAYSINMDLLRTFLKALEEYAKSHNGMLPYEFQFAFLSPRVMEAAKDFAFNLANLPGLDDTVTPIRLNPSDDESSIITNPTTEVEWFRVLTQYASLHGPLLSSQLKLLPRYNYEVKEGSEPGLLDITGRLSKVFNKAAELALSSSAASLDEPKASRLIINAVIKALPSELVQRVLDEEIKQSGARAITARYSLAKWKLIFAASAQAWFAKSSVKTKDILWSDAKTPSTTDSKADDQKKVGKPAAPATSAAGNNSNNGGAAGGWHTVSSRQRTAPSAPAATAAKAATAAPAAAASAAAGASESNATASWTADPCRNCNAGGHCMRNCPRPFCRNWNFKPTCHLGDKCKFFEFHTNELKGSQTEPAAIPRRTARAN
jgi:hypothetical protein